MQASHSEKENCFWKRHRKATLSLFGSQGTSLRRVSADGDEGTPVPIPNTEVKLIYADDTWLEAARENKKVLTQKTVLVNRTVFSFFTTRTDVCVGKGRDRPRGVRKGNRKGKRIFLLQCRRGGNLPPARDPLRLRRVTRHGYGGSKPPPYGMESGYVGCCRGGLASTSSTACGGPPSPMKCTK